MGFISGYITWDRINKSIAKKSNAEEFYCNVDGFWHGRRRHNVNFKFAGKGEEFEISRETYRRYSDKAPSAYRLHIIARKGVGNYYVVDNWEIETKEK
ncbi:MAG: hypothetical protein JWO03_477 [Bacteroidetes bacterium]|nr:hypothetical protein [Bacteroidota bacterium]